MRKMYFAMIPKRSAFESLATMVGVGVGVVYGAKWLLGEEKFNEYKAALKDMVLTGSSPDIAVQQQGQGPDTGVGIADDDAKAREEASIVERIRRAAKL